MNNRHVAPGIMAREVPGLRELLVLRRIMPTEAEAEFLTLMTFDDWASVGRFAGEDAAASVVPPAARALLARRDERSQHFELRQRFQATGS
jgi:hypothetical protein